MKTIRPIAIYLPQFHPVPENDEWWGKGFTEWRNVVKAKPRFEGHYQPHLPADLGFYDLRLPDIREAQADLARKYNIHGFCYYHYWFNGKRILERPFEEVFQSGKPDFPFMLCWANENWTRIWDGGEANILLKQDYSVEDDENHIRSLIPYFKDPRYIRVNGRPVFAIYKDSVFPDIKRTTDTFRAECTKHGIDVYLCKFERAIGSLAKSPDELGFDAAIEFQPLSTSRREFRNSKKSLARWLSAERYIDAFNRYVRGKKSERDQITDMSEFVEFDIKREPPNYKIYPCVSPSWDNSSRRVDKKAVIFVNSAPAVFRKWVREKVRKFKPYSAEENFLFINAWNEWAEGNHLEPDEKFGHGYLQALKQGVEEATHEQI
jgi:hypothetical protein